MPVHPPRAMLEPSQHPLLIHNRELVSYVAFPHFNTKVKHELQSVLLRLSIDSRQTASGILADENTFYYKYESHVDRDYTIRTMCP